MISSRSILKRAFPALAVVPLVATFGVAAQKDVAITGPWSGILVSSACNADEAFMEIPDCYKDQPGAKLALIDDTTRVMYELDTTGAAGVHLGDPVTVKGVLDGDVIRKASIAPMSIGLAVGQKAPAFSLRDQFGHVQTLDSLKGTRGTVLLFFRSADW